MNGTLRSARGPAATAAALLLAGAALFVAGDRARPDSSIDFYQFWAMGAARGLAHEPLPTPWADVAPTASVLRSHLDDVDDPGLRRVHGYRMGDFEPFGSPLLYALFAPLPTDYAQALSIFRALQLAAFGAGVLGLVRLAGWSSAAGAIAVALLAVGYGPFGDDLFTGNLNALQLAALVGVLALLRPVGARSLAAGRAALALSLLAGLLLVKANTGLVCAALAACVVAAGRGGAGLRVAWGAALLAAVALIVASSAYFGDAVAWLDWLRLVFLDDPRRLSDYAVARGNSSTPRLLFESLGLDPLVGAALVAGSLVVSLAAAAGFGRAGLHAFWDAALAEPPLAASLAVVASAALLPLAWFHYFVWMLVPLLWAGLPAERSPRVRALAGAALVLYSGAYLPWIAGSALQRGLPAVFAIAWLLPWTALLLHLRQASALRAPSID